MVASLKDERLPEWVARWMGERLSAPTAVDLPPSRFHCLLDDQPTHLVPLRLWSRLGANSSDECLVLNRDLFLSRDGVLPPQVSPYTRLLAGFAWAGTVAWLRDPACDALQPFWLGSELAAAVDAISPETPAPAGLSSRLRKLLAQARILVPPNYSVRRQEEWRVTISHTSPLFQQKGYAPVSGLLHPFHLAALRRYYRYLIRTGRLQLGDGQSPQRYVAHNQSVARYFHHQLTSTVSAIAGEPVKPSYVYLASYQNGAELEKHTDREQCDFSITLCLDYSPEPACETPWPIHLDTSTGTATVFQAIGDALLYRGSQLPHYRGPLPEGHTSTSIFFHYVRGDFNGKLD